MLDAILILTVIGVFFTVTNFVVVSAIPSVAFLALSPLVAFVRGPLPPITRWAIAYYAISLTSLMLFNPGAIFVYDFYRYNGNFIISFAPFLALPLFSVRADLYKLLVRFLLISTIVNLSVFVWDVAGPGPIIHGLFYAPNAYGGFLMFTTGAAYVWWYRGRSSSAFVIAALNFFLLVVSYSRGSILGLAAALFSFHMLEKSRGYLVALVIACIVLSECGILYFTYPIYLETGRAITGASADPFLGFDTGKENNLAIRAFQLWPKALYLFFHSPLFGAGFGTTPDPELTFSSDVSLFQFNQSPVRSYTDGHAHNTYLNILGEQGIVGLLVFLGLWRAVYRFIRDHRDLPILRDTLMIAFWSLTFSSFTEHRIATPSNALPFTLFLLLYYAYVTNRKAGDARARAGPLTEGASAEFGPS